MTAHDLTLERKHQFAAGIVGNIAITPPIDEDYWRYRVRLTDRQAVLGFPKFHTVGIGFAVEDDWNTNLPYTCDATEIYEHIAHNKGDDSISRDDCIAAIRLIQDAVRTDREHADDRR